MKYIAKQCSVYGEKLQCPPTFIAVMLRAIVDAFITQRPKLIAIVLIAKNVFTSTLFHRIILTLLLDVK